MKKSIRKKSVIIDSKTENKENKPENLQKKSKIKQKENIK